MKKILMIMVMALAAVGMKAITVDEAYEQIAAIPGAAISDVPEYDCTKEGMDWGKVVMFIGANQSTVAQVEKVLAEITDPEVLNTKAQGNNQVLGYATQQENGRTRAIVYVSMPGAGSVVLYAQGGDDVVSGMKIN